MCSLQPNFKTKKTCVCETWAWFLSLNIFFFITVKKTTNNPAICKCVWVFFFWGGGLLFVCLFFKGNENLLHKEKRCWCLCQMFTVLQLVSQRETFEWNPDFLTPSGRSWLCVSGWAWRLSSFGQVCLYRKLWEMFVCLFALSGLWGWGSGVWAGLSRFGQRLPAERRAGVWRLGDHGTG